MNLIQKATYRNFCTIFRPAYNNIQGKVIGTAIYKKKYRYENSYILQLNFDIIFLLENLQIKKYFLLFKKSRILRLANGPSYCMELRWTLIGRRDGPPYFSTYLARVTKTSRHIVTTHPSFLLNNNLHSTCMVISGVFVCVYFEYQRYLVEEIQVFLELFLQNKQDFGSR